jgi:excisionase family DNA binding protein
MCDADRRGTSVVMRDKLTNIEAAEVLRISPLTLKDWAREGRISSYKIGRRRLFAPGDLEEFLNANRCPANRSLAGRTKPPIGT